jgi:hypothetical protein
MKSTLRFPDLWSAVPDSDIESAAKRFPTFNKGTQDLIRAEIRRRGLAVEVPPRSDERDPLHRAILPLAVMNRLFSPALPVRPNSQLDTLAMIRRRSIGAALVMAGVLVVPILVPSLVGALLVPLGFGELVSMFCLLVAMWWQPLVLPYATTYDAEGQWLPLPLLTAGLQWTIVIVSFGLICRRLRPWQQLSWAIVTMVLVGILSHVVIKILGFTFVFDGP